MLRLTLLRHTALLRDILLRLLLSLLRKRTLTRWLPLRRHELLPLPLLVTFTLLVELPPGRIMRLIAVVLPAQTWLLL